MPSLGRTSLLLISCVCFSDTSVHCSPRSPWERENGGGVDLLVLLTERRTRRAVCGLASLSLHFHLLPTCSASRRLCLCHRDDPAAHVWHGRGACLVRGLVSSVLPQGYPGESLTTNAQVHDKATPVRWLEPTDGSLSIRHAKRRSVLRRPKRAGPASSEAPWREAPAEAIVVAAPRHVRCHEVDGLPCTASFAARPFGRAGASIPKRVTASPPASHGPGRSQSDTSLGHPLCQPAITRDKHPITESRGESAFRRHQQAPVSSITLSARR